MDLIAQLTRKQLQLRELLENRKFALAGIELGSSLQEMEWAIQNGDIDPQDDWVLETPVLLESPPNLRQATRYHWRASQLQVAYFQHLLHKSYVQQRELAHAKKRMFHHNEMIIALSEAMGWGLYHWAFAEDSSANISVPLLSEPGKGEVHDPSSVKKRTRYWAA